MTYNQILKVIPTIQAAALVGNSVRFLKKKKKRPTDFLSNATETMVGAAFIKEEANFLS